MPDTSVLGDETERTAKPGLPAVTLTLDGITDNTSPEGVLLAESDTTPEKPFKLVRVTVEFREDPAGTVKTDGPALFVKSSTWTVSWAVWMSDPLVAVTITV